MEFISAWGQVSQSNLEKFLLQKGVLRLMTFSKTSEHGIPYFINFNFNINLQRPAVKSYLATFSSPYFINF